MSSRNRPLNHEFSLESAPQPIELETSAPAEMGTTANIRELESPREVLEMDVITPFGDNVALNTLHAGGFEKPDTRKKTNDREGLVELEGDPARRSKSLRWKGAGGLR